jgi:PST family polysaccharide transporter
LLHGVAWTGGLKWATQVLSWAATLVVARILTPSDYGLFGLATLYAGLIQLINEFGLGAAVVRRRDLTEPQIAAVGGVSLALGASLWGLSALAAPLVATFFHAPDLRWVIVAMGITFVTTGIRVIPKSLLGRDLQFRRVASIDAVEAVTTTATVLAFAIAGFRYWALVIGTIAGSAASTAVALAWRRHRIIWPKAWAEVAGAVEFGSHIVVSRISWYLYSNADFAVVGKRLGTATLGAYNLGWTLASIPVDRVAGLVAQVTPAVFSAVQTQPAELRRYLLRISEGLAFITFPASVGLALVADQFVVVCLGDKWWPAIGPLALLACYAGVRSVTAPFPHILQAVGESGRAMRYNLLALAVLPPMFLAGSHWGAVGVAGAWIIGYPLITMPMLRAVLRAIELRMSDYLDALRPPLVGTLLMSVAVIAVRSALPDRLPVAAQFGIAVTVGVLTYAIVMLAGYRARLETLRGVLRELRR